MFSCQVLRPVYVSLAVSYVPGMCVSSICFGFQALNLLCVLSMANQSTDAETYLKTCSVTSTLLLA